MASIEKLSIRGIRSFSPDRDQVIEFYSPLTMIVGHNGCGKTTIIECLKYMLTGTLPPGTKSGQYFINDPKVSGAQEVKANIKLRLRNRAGHGMVSIRYFQLTQTRARLTFKALDGVIRTFGSNGETKSMSNKCSDMDKQMPELFGVSKAILESVIFCHQEEANWPLMEGKFLKEKFDDIFEATRYAKALEAIRKTKKSHSEKVKEIKIDLAGLDERLSTAKQIQSDLDKAERQLNRNADDIAAVDDRIREANAELATLNADLNRLRTQQASVDAKRREVESAHKEVEIQRRSVRLMMDMSDEDLRDMLNNFGSSTAETKDHLEQLKRTLAQKRGDVRRALAEREVLVSELGELKAQIAAFRRAQRGRDGHLRTLSEKYAIPVPATVSGHGPGRPTVTAEGVEEDATDPDYDNATVKRFAGKLQERLAEREAALAAARSEAHAEERIAQDAVSDLRRQEDDVSSSLAASEAKLATIKAAHAQAFKRYAELRSASAGGTLAYTASQSVMSQSAPGALPERLARAKAEQEGLAGDPSKKALPREISGIRGELDAVAKDEGRLKERRSFMETFQDEEQELDASLRRLHGLATKIAISTEVQSEKLEHLTDVGLDTSLVQNLPYDWAKVAADLDSPLASLESKLMQATSAMGEAKEQLAERRRLATQSDAHASRDGDTRERVQDRLAAMTSISDTVEAAGAFARDFCDFQPNAQLPLAQQAEEILEALALEPVELEDRRIVKIIGVSLVSRTYLAKMNKLAAEEPGACPCCDRRFESVREKENFITKYEKKADLAARSKDETLASQGDRLKMVERMKGLMKDWRTWVQLTEQEVALSRSIEEGKAQRARVDEELQHLGEAVEAGEDRVRVLEAALSEAQAHQADIATARDLASAVDRARADIAAKSVGGLDSGTYPSLKEQRSIVTLKDAQAALEELRSAKDILVSRERERIAALANLESRSNQMAERVRDLERQVREEAEQRAELETVAQEKETTKAEQKTLEADIKALASRRNDVAARLPAAERALQQVRTRAQERVQGRSAACDECRRDVAELERRVLEVEALRAKGFVARRQSAQESTARLSETADSLRAEVETLEGEAAQMQRTLDDKEGVRHTAEQNLAFRASEAALKAAESELVAAESAFEAGAGADARRLQDRSGRLVKRREEDTEARAELRGVQRGLEQQRAELTTRLASSQCRNIAEEHTRKLIEFETTQIVVQDLDKFYRAVDSALMKYHSAKITDINRIVRELWQLTYKGLDIEAIEIVGEEGGSTTGSRARSYNYKVMMRKGDARLEMRGRCSAGQRVLAAIVIRLALAETFCLKCGILALDEPTTNLDFDNKLGLAHALAMIIGARSQQHNFQLVCITHDEEFVSMMNAQLQAQSGLPMPEYYWKIEREQLASGRYFSRIDRVDWSDMQ